MTRREACVLCGAVALALGCSTPARTIEPSRRPAAPELTEADPAGTEGEDEAPLNGVGPVEIRTRTLRPERRDATDARVARLTVPQGFAVSVFARDLENPRTIAVTPDGAVLVVQRDAGSVIALLDTDGDGRADEREVVASGLAEVHGITIHRGTVYLAGNRNVWAAELGERGRLGRPELVIDDLPDAGQHPNRTLAFGPDQRLYVSVGSTCNACDEPNPEHATLLRFTSDLRAREVFAEGLRNTIGFAWHPVTGELWGMDHGSDMRGDASPPEELNHIREGLHYGWPWVNGDRVPDPVIAHPDGTTKEELAGRTEPPVLTYTAHAAPMGLVFYTGDQFPPEYRDDAFITLRGSWNRNPPVGYGVARVRFEDGRPTAIEELVTGFLIEGGRAHFGRPVGITMARDGALLFTDDTNGVVYRVAHRNGSRSSTGR